MWNLYVLFIYIVHIICIFLVIKIEKFSLKLKIFSKNFLSEVKSFCLKANFRGQIFQYRDQILYTNYITN